MANTKYTYNEKRKEWYTLVYDGTLTETGAKHRKRISSKKSSADLEKKVIAFKTELNSKGIVQASTITFGEYGRKWLETAKATKEANTQRTYKVTLDSCFGSINDVPLAKLTHSNFQQCINQKMDHPRTCQLIKLTFTQIIKAAIRDHYLPHSALEELTVDISIPKYKKPLKRALTDNEKKALKAAELDEKKRAFVSLLYYCGMRKSEALALDPGDFNWNDNTVSITKTVIFGSNASEIKPYPKSDNGMRVIPLPAPCVDVLKPYVANSKGLLFTGLNGAVTTSSYRRMWESIIKSMNEAAEEPIDGLTAHIFRHNYCTELCYQVPLISTKKIAQLLGDDEKMVLDVYSHIQEEKEDVRAALENIF